MIKVYNTETGKEMMADTTQLVALAEHGWQREKPKNWVEPEPKEEAPEVVPEPDDIDDVEDDEEDLGIVTGDGEY